MAVITFSNSAVDMRQVNDSFGIAPMQAAYEFLSSYSPIDAYAVTSSSSYMQLRAYDADYDYTSVYLWLTGQSSTSISLSKMALEIEETGFYTSITGSMTINDSASFWGTITGLTVKNADTGTTYVTASGLNLYLSGNAFSGIDPTSSLASGLSGNDSITGGAYSDHLLAYGGNDTIEGGAGNDTMSGGIGNDIYYVRQSGDVVKENTGEGTDTVYSYLASDTLDVNIENGVIKLTVAANLAGNGSANTLTGNAFANRLSGAAGIDLLKGGDGADTLVGGAGRDSLFGGSVSTNTGDGDRDVFDFNYTTESAVGVSNRDKIYNFVSGTDDIDLSGIDAKVLTTDSNYNNTFAFSVTTAKAYSAWYVKADADGDGLIDDIVVRGDVNGNTMADFEIAVIGTSSISVGDFVL